MYQDNFRFTIGIIQRPGVLQQTSFTNSSNGCYQIAQWALNANVDTLLINGVWCANLREVEREIAKVVAESKKRNQVSKELV